MTLLVSVIIPCRNAATWLGEAIESCLGQTWREIEIIVVDNGSSDASLEVAQRYQSSSVTVLECARRGASAARNLGLAQARGELIQFLDADDVLDREKIRVQVECLSTAPAGSIASGAWARFRDRPAEEAFVVEPVWRDLSGEAFLMSSWSGGGMMATFVWLTPRAVIEKAGWWNERLSLNDDGEFFSRVVLAATGIEFCDAARGYYRRGSAAAVSRWRDQEALASALAAIELSCSHLLARCASAEATQACAAAYQRFICDVYPAVPDLVAAAEQRVTQFGGSDLRPQGGPAFETLSRWLGWKAAKRCQSAWWRLSGLIPAGPEDRQ